MTPFDQLLQFIVRSWRWDVSVIAKTSVVFLLVLYLGFALVVVRQVHLMSQTVRAELNGLIMLAAKLLVAIAVGAIIMGLLIL